MCGSQPEEATEPLRPLGPSAPVPGLLQERAHRHAHLHGGDSVQGQPVRWKPFTISVRLDFLYLVCVKKFIFFKSQIYTKIDV